MKSGEKLCCIIIESVKKIKLSSVSRKMKAHEGWLDSFQPTESVQVTTEQIYSSAGQNESTPQRLIL